MNGKYKCHQLSGWKVNTLPTFIRFPRTATTGAFSLTALFATFIKTRAELACLSNARVLPRVYKYNNQ